MVRYIIISFFSGVISVIIILLGIYVYVLYIVDEPKMDTFEKSQLQNTPMLNLEQLLSLRFKDQQGRSVSINSEKKVSIVCLFPATESLESIISLADKFEPELDIYLVNYELTKGELRKGYTIDTKKDNLLNLYIENYHEVIEINDTYVVFKGEIIFQTNKTRNWDTPKNVAFLKNIIMKNYD